MKLEKLTRKDMDTMEIEAITITRFKPIQKKMKHICQIFINKELVEESEFKVPDTLESKTEFFISIANQLHERAGAILREIYNR